MPVAIVTGSDSGIGRAAAVKLAESGFDIGITWHEDEEGAQDTAREVQEKGRGAEIRRLDLTKLPQVADVVDELADALGGIDVLVNNAGTGATAEFLEFEWEDWQRDISVDLSGPFLCSQRAARRMVDQGRGGRIINVTSVHEHIPLRGSSAYCSAKGGLGMLTKVMALELGEHGISVNAVAPGEIATPMTGQEDEDPGNEDRPVPIGRPGNAHEIAAFIAFLASPDARYATGESIVVDGGLMLLAAEANAGRT